MSAESLRQSAKPFVIALLSAGLTIAGTMVKDRVTVEHDRATAEAVIVGLGKRIDLHEERINFFTESVVTRAELKEDLEGIERRLDDIRLMVAESQRKR